MEPQFKSSFIPKKPVAPVSMRQARVQPRGLLFVLGLVVFIAAILMAGGVFGYGKYLEVNIAKKSKALEDARVDLQPALVEEIRRLDARMRGTQTLLQNHVALSPVFDLLETTTLVSVQYTSFGYLFNPEGGVTLALSGIAPSFAALALQSDVLYRNTNFTRVEFTAVDLDSFGNVVFDLELDIDPKVISYKNFVAETAVESVEEAAAVPATSATSTVSTSTNSTAPRPPLPTTPTP